MSTPIRVMVVDDHPVVRNGIRFSLLTVEDIELAGTAGSGREALRVCADVLPDVVLMDMVMPDMSGAATTQAIRQRYPQVQVVALTSFQDSKLVQEALRAGAIGYLLKDTSVEDLARAIRLAYARQATLAPTATDALLHAAEKPFEPGDDLTPRQREVLALLAQGRRNDEIAEQLNIALSTVRFHISIIYAKLGAANRAEAAALAVKHGLI